MGTLLTMNGRMDMTKSWIREDSYRLDTHHIKNDLDVSHRVFLKSSTLWSVECVCVCVAGPGQHEHHQLMTALLFEVSGS